MATATHDDGFHEIQLNGKQLVFLFMAVTVVLVVTFLCGVLVGRDLQLNREGASAVDTLTGTADPDVAPPPPVSSDLPGTRSQPIADKEALTYDTLLEDGAAPQEKLRSANAPEPPPAKAERVEPAPPTSSPSVAPPAAAPAVPAAPAEPGGAGLAIQVAAVREKTDADRIANRLIGKGYKAYVVTPAAGAPAVFRVRVGKFKEQREADSVAARLKKEEQFSPWIVR